MFFNCVYCVYTGVYLGGVRILQGPRDVHVQRGEVATFPCQYEGTQSFPYWRIGVKLYTALNLPRHHRYSGPKQELVIRYTQHESIRSISYITTDISRGASQEPQTKEVNFFLQALVCVHITFVCIHVVK